MNVHAACRYRVRMREMETHGERARAHINMVLTRANNVEPGFEIVGGGGVARLGENWVVIRV